MNDLLFQAALSRAADPRVVLQKKMRYIDLHCDALTAEGVSCVTKDNLKKGGVLLQCFAAFIKEKEGRFERAVQLCEKFERLCEEQAFQPVRCVSDIKTDQINALLTVEGGGAIEGSLEKLEKLYLRGVRMMTLVWNKENELGFPNMTENKFRREKKRGLTEFGRAVVTQMNALGVIVDVSHGSDLLVEEVARLCKRSGKAFVASHSGAEAVQTRSRNLEDRQIRLIAETGGIVGLDFCIDFTSDDCSKEGQKKALLAHVEHLMKIGGEDLPAIGSDFDGTKENPYLKSPADMPVFFESLIEKFGESIAEKIAYKNALRVLRENLTRQDTQTYLSSSEPKRME